MSGRVGRYTLIHRLGQGGVANIFLARRDGSNEACVLKLLRAEEEGDRHSMARFQREAQLASLLHHPNIARITDAQFEDGTFYIAMEHIRGHTIGELMRRLLTNGMLPSIGTVVFIGARALEGLAYAHELADPDGRALGLVHRDLSLRNIMVSYAGEVKIIDFGIARGDIGRYKTAPGIVLGTIYVAGTSDGG